MQRYVYLQYDSGLRVPQCAACRSAIQHFALKEFA